GAGNPVKEGAVSGNTMTLTLNDNTTVDIDVTSLVVPDGITVDSPNWFQHFQTPGAGDTTAGPQLTYTTHPAADAAKNPYYWGTPLQPGQELVWTATGGPKDIVLGIWGGATTFTPSPYGGESNTTFRNTNWTKMLRFYGSPDYIYNEGATDETTGFIVGMAGSTNWWYTPNSNIFALRYDAGDHKLRLYEISTGMEYLVATARVAEDGSNKTISAAFGYHSGSAGNTDIPQFVQRDYMYSFAHRTSSSTNQLWRDGLVEGDIIKTNVTLRPGYKWKFTTTTDTGTDVAQWHSFDYTGTATGQSNWWDANSASLKWTSTAQWTNSDNIGSWTTNTSATRYSASNTTSAMAGVLVSWRYHPTTNIIDLYDEGNEEVLFTLDTAKDGSPVHLFIASNATAAIPAANVPQSFTLDRHDEFKNRSYGFGSLSEGYNDWFVDVGPRAGLPLYDRGTGAGGDTAQWKDQPFRWDRKLRAGESFIFQPNLTTTEGYIYIGVGEHTQHYQDRNDNAQWTWNVVFDQNDINTQTGWQYATEATEPGYGNHTASPFVKIDGQVAHNDTVEFHYNATDNRVYGYLISDGPHRMLIGRSIEAHDGNPITISCSVEHSDYRWSNLPTFAMGGDAWYIQLEKTSGSPTFRADASYPSASVNNSYTPLRWGRTLHPGDEMNWTHCNQRTDSQAHHFGILKSSTTTPGSMSG
ncbi:MAG: hypothetical protein GY893_05790, partial [bacterium]|nr:hypothetical protein [bacterium]